MILKQFKAMLFNYQHDSLKIRVICVLESGVSTGLWSEQERVGTVEGGGEMSFFCCCFKAGTVGRGMACSLALLGMSPDKHPETVRPEKRMPASASRTPWESRESI